MGIVHPAFVKGVTSTVFSNHMFLEIEAQLLSLSCTIYRLIFLCVNRLVEIFDMRAGRI